MKREVRLLHSKSLDSLVVAIEHFNRSTDRGRVEAVLILLDHAFELLLKAAIIHKGGRIREPRAKETIGFDKCVRKCLSEAQVKCLSEEQALTIQIINSLRDAAQHYVVQVSEQQLYMYAQAGVTLYGAVLESVFGIKLRDQVPERVLPVTTSPPTSLAKLIETEFSEVKALLKPASRQKLGAKAKLRSLAIIEASVSGERSQPTETDLNKLIKGIKKGTKWEDLFPGIASLNLSTEGTGLNVSIKLTKKEGEPVQLVPEGTPGATIVAVKRVNELDYYSMGLKTLAKHLKLNMARALAVVWYEKIQQDEEYYKEFKIGKQVAKRYSKKALDHLTETLNHADMNAIWEEYKRRNQPVGKAEAVA